MRPSMVIVCVIAFAIFAGAIRIRGKVRKRHTTRRRHRAVLPPCNFNDTIIEDEWSLMEAIGDSKFIFTAKVLNVKKLKTGDVGRGKKSNLYRLHLRRVLKGDVDEFRTFVAYEGSSEDTLGGSTLWVERPRAQSNCQPSPRPRLSAIFLSDGAFVGSEKGPTPRLRLLTDPVPLTLYHLDRVNAAVKVRRRRFVGSATMATATRPPTLVPLSKFLARAAITYDVIQSRTTITNDYEILSSAVSESKYIFTARVLRVRKIKRGKKPKLKVFISYKLYLRLVMKGDVDELKNYIISGDDRTLNGGIVFVDWLQSNKCAYKLYRHSSGIFLSDGFYGGLNGEKQRLRLLNEPLPLSLYDLDRVNAALKGKCLPSYNLSVRMAVYASYKSYVFIMCFYCEAVLRKVEA
ncbi:hypothetical protein RR46_11916 [Papilio xuthus]|uniref:Uncharacterized protein n=1 Tax=Papilio xuthus TaxID=66420 RepID=A0A194PNL8_PAPXU|nr:hypothetical protein RR46_11916 [Papilio xuthus]